MGPPVRSQSQARTRFPLQGLPQLAQSVMLLLPAMPRLQSAALPERPASALSALIQDLVRPSMRLLALQDALLPVLLDRSVLACLTMLMALSRHASCANAADPQLLQFNHSFQCRDAWGVFGFQLRLGRKHRRRKNY